jgi:hypothetical protein
MGVEAAIAGNIDVALMAIFCLSMLFWLRTLNYRHDQFVKEVTMELAMIDKGIEAAEQEVSRLRAGLEGEREVHND